MSLVKKMGLEIDDIVFSPIATAQIALDSQRREQGALLIDIGGGTTEYALYLNGKVTASGCIPEGGVHVTHDIQLATGLPFSKAELLKVIEGDVSGNPEKSLGTAVLTDEKDAEKVEVQRTMLNEVIRQRVEIILKSVRSSLPDGALDSIGAGVFVTGGTSQMQGFIELAADVFGPNINRISPPQFSGIQANFEDPRCFTAHGLIRYAQIMQTDQD
jgi:cell division protein FtsA